jgi:hypothetical protein
MDNAARITQGPRITFSSLGLASLDSLDFTVKALVSLARRFDRLLLPSLRTLGFEVPTLALGARSRNLARVFLRFDLRLLALLEDVKHQSSQGAPLGHWTTSVRGSIAVIYIF